MEIDDKKFNQVKDDAKKCYEGLGRVKCPYLKDEVHFNSEGFEHLLNKSWNRDRSRVEQYTRCRLLPKVVEIIQKSHTVQEYDERKMFVRQKTNSRWEKRFKIVKYFIFIALLVERKIKFKIIIKQIEGGQPFFWSVYPSWRKETEENGKEKKVFYSGNLEED